MEAVLWAMVGAMAANAIRDYKNTPEYRYNQNCEFLSRLQNNPFKSQKEAYDVCIESGPYVYSVLYEKEAGRKRVMEEELRKKNLE